MELNNEAELEIPEALFKLLSKAAVANGRTMGEEIIARLAASLDQD
jgi:Arc-like DNA binding domain